jgi:acetyl-CoA carboxylase biotin carboxyl carrier protein
VSQQLVKADMAGMVLDVSCTVGDAITAGQELLVMESMKMEFPVVARVSGTIVEILVLAGDSVVEGQHIATLQA